MQPPSSTMDQLEAAEKQPDASTRNNDWLELLRENPNMSSNDVFMYLTGEHDIIRFLNWALSQLYPYEKFNLTKGGLDAEYYHPGMYIWKKLNLSGQIEPPMLIEEPHYIIVRKDHHLQEQLKTGKTAQSSKIKSNFC